MRLFIDTSNHESYARFLRVRQLPTYRFIGDTVEFPDEYADLIDAAPVERQDVRFRSSTFLWDYQKAVTGIAIDRRKFCVFADCGLGKTLVLLEYARHVAEQIKKNECVLIVSPLMVIPQTIREAVKFYGDMSIECVAARDLSDFLDSGAKIGITNFEALNQDISRGRLAGLIIDESSMLKGHYGKWGTTLVRLGRGLQWKLCLTGTPAPNDRIEFAQHAVLMDAHPTVNSFLAKYFINRGQTDNRWEIKPHAVGSFYRDMSHWAIFLSNPAVYGWKDHSAALPPINVHIEDIPLTDEQRRMMQLETGDLFVTELGGITSRAKLATIAKGFYGDALVDTNKTHWIVDKVAASKDQTIIWCIYNREQQILSDAIPDAASMYGDTPLEKRIEMLDEFKAGRTRTLITKPKILGFGLNLQHVTQHIFSGLQDSYESYYQAIKRSNRYGSTEPLDVQIPVTEIERPMVENVLRKAARVQRDTDEQERLFKANAPHWLRMGNS